MLLIILFNRKKNVFEKRRKKCLLDLFAYIYSLPLLAFNMYMFNISFNSPR